MLVALSRLSSAATAHAECAWVLWSETMGDSTPWKLVAAWSTESRCDAERLSAYKSDGMNVGPAGAFSSLGVIPPGQTGAFSSLGGQTIYRRYVCLPDTVDPRKPNTKCRTVERGSTCAVRCARDHNITTDQHGVVLWLVLTLC